MSQTKADSTPSRPRDASKLGATIPSAYNLVVRPTHWVDPKTRLEVQKATEFNAFSFPASMLVCDYLSDSGSSAMTDIQWAAMFRGDESYGRNHGYFALMQAVRNTFERGDNPIPLANRILCDEKNLTWCPDLKQLHNPEQGGFANGGKMQLIRPNFFIVPQGRCAEHLLYSTLREVLGKTGKKYIIPSNGFFDTTEAQCAFAGIQRKNLFHSDLMAPFPADEQYTRNPFKGDIDIEGLKAVIKEHGADAIPIILLTITNNTAAGQPVSMKCIEETAAIAKEHKIPLFFDAARFAENAYFIKCFEEGYADVSIPEIVRRMFSHVDAFTMSMKKDALCNMGGLLCIRDQCLFHERMSKLAGRDIGVAIKEKQILNFGNDSYGGMSGRDIMAAAIGLEQILRMPYLERRITQCMKLAEDLEKAGVPVVLPAGGHAVYIDMDKFFEGTDMKIDDFGGVGLAVELIRLYGIRVCELGAFAFEWDQKTPEQRKGILNVVRIAVPRNIYSADHMDYTVAAIKELYDHKEQLPKVIVSRGAELRLRHFQSGLTPIWPKGFEPEGVEPAAN